ncbi:class II aldolase/adducin family protein [Pigmentiphaga sp. H8]|uniref:class II aldolase/adducin family protein n=1 Tax=Pigmentiphaga sp. H8 TaxID=2488560 RepID=UPI000F5B4AEA|nr:class II aldolase/adducin family protein [Pigmentiphaga sp. H8]AZG09743.1 class II aldolase/adducin family protein [Pigmentiphaga sp. H8]
MSAPARLSGEDAALTPLDQAKQTLIAAGRVLAAHGQGDMTRGHISVRVPGDPSLFLMKPHGFGFDEMTMDNIVTCDLEGRKVAGHAGRHSEVFIHSEIYRARPDVESVLHAHPAQVVAFTATGRKLRPISQPGAVFAEGVPVYTGSIDLVRTPEMGADVAAALGPCKAVLMRHHGMAIASRSVQETVVLALMLDEACTIQLLAEAGGARLCEEFPADDVMKLHDKLNRPAQFGINFDYLHRCALRRGAT